MWNKKERELAHGCFGKTWPRVHKAFQNNDQDQAQVKHFLYYGLLKKKLL